MNYARIPKNFKNLKAISIITAAGLGLRLKEYSFKKYGKYLDKPLVDFKGKSLLYWSIKPFFPLITNGILNFSDIYVVIRKEQDFEAFKNECKSIHELINIIRIEKLSKGPAHTAFEALKKISTKRNISNMSIIVSDSDHTFRCDGLIKEFRGKNRFNAFCTLKNVPNPEKWGYIMKNDMGDFISGEKNIVTKSDINYKNANFLIGCYLYKDFQTLSKGLKDYEIQNKDGVESHHSHILSNLSKSEPVKNINSNWGIGLGTPEQISEASSTIISFEGNREPPTYIIDIDGVIFNHDNGRFSENGNFSDNPIPILENIKIINNLYENGAVIILCSSRPKDLLLKTKEDLQKIGLSYSEIYLGATSGQRFLINDRKPSNLSIDTAISINSDRNLPFTKRISGNIDFFKDSSKGSGANTAILFDKTNNKISVRKWVKSNKINVRETLYKQFSYLKTISQHIGDSLPEIIDWKFSPFEISFYDMTFIKSKPFVYDSFLDDKKKINSLINVISKLYENSLYSPEHENINYLSKEIIRKKLTPTIKNCFSELSNLIDNYSEVLPTNLLGKLNNYLDKLIKNNDLWSKHLISNIHGDLTLENILFDSLNKIYLIDPLGSTMDVRKNGAMDQFTTTVFDLGKLMQSTISKYESWAYLDENDINLFIRNFSIEEEYQQIENNFYKSNIFFEFYNQYIGSDIKLDCLFACAQTLIRVAPYRIRANYKHSALLCILKSYAIFSFMYDE